MREAITISELREVVRAWRSAGESVAFVPTMGNLHGGHAYLVDQARAYAKHVVVSIFVNPLQFGVHEDLANYPRTVEQDRQLLREHEADLLFLPSVKEMYPLPFDQTTKVAVPGLSDILCGASRPGHFVGVATVVAHLFNIVQPDLALFGEKDFQQLRVIEHMTRDLAFPIEIRGVATVRAPDGLAMSSRNGYLSSEQRALAPRLYAVLQSAKSRLQQNDRDFASIEQEAYAQLAMAGFRPDYVTIRLADDLTVPKKNAPALVIMAAAWLGRARLIDNVRWP